MYPRIDSIELVLLSTCSLNSVSALRAASTRPDETNNNTRNNNTHNELIGDNAIDVVVVHRAVIAEARLIKEGRRLMVGEVGVPVYSDGEVHRILSMRRIRTGSRKEDA